MLRRSTLLLPLLAALACGPGARQSSQQSVAPVSDQDPMVACADAVLAESPLVERVVASGSNTSPRGRWLTLRQRSSSLGFRMEPSSGAPRLMVVRYAWPAPRMALSGVPPRPDSTVSNLEGELLADISTRLLHEVRAQCAPSAPGEPVCSRVEQGRAGRCDFGV